MNRTAPTRLAEIPPSAHEQVKAALMPALKSWCARVCEGVENGERTAMNLWARAIGVVGADVEVNIALLVTKELGVSSIEEAKRKMAMLASVEGIDEDSAMSAMEQHVRFWYAARGKRLVIVSDVDEVPHVNGTH